MQTTFFIELGFWIEACFWDKIEHNLAFPFLPGGQVLRGSRR